jgi:hypothetical protein
MQKKHITSIYQFGISHFRVIRVISWSACLPEKWGTITHKKDHQTSRPGMANEKC